MTHFETVLVQSIRDLALQVQETNILCARLDERSEATEQRLLALEACAARVAAAPPPSSRRSKITVREAGISAGAVIALATAILSALGGHAPAPAAAPPAAPIAAGTK